MNLIGDICFPNGKYQDRATGEEKTRWVRCGVLVQNEQGDYRIKLDSVPLNGGEGWFSVFARKQQDQPRPASTSGAPAQAPAPQGLQFPADDVPW